MDILILNKIDGHEDEIQQIKDELKHEKNVRLYKRYSDLLKHFEGFSNRKIAEMENLDEHTVGIYIKNYKLNGLAGLNMGHSTGATRKINAEQEKFKKDFEVLKKTP